jgi:hypothetical protein
MKAGSSNLSRSGYAFNNHIICERLEVLRAGMWIQTLTGTASHTLFESRCAV